MKGGVLKWKCKPSTYYKGEGAGETLKVCNYVKDNGVAGSSCKVATQAEITQHEAGV